eukprot:TRINITY_DN33267_c0_g1_i1.p1 TRINITY_DN33267_c0_g1~~TRINITY_DN33267_c0_g1_i1.p1  ORF type:complete len:563 (-),score=121.41 TRINITY_DN33267_c0_g1_i1:300-1988(-)
MVAKSLAFALGASSAFARSDYGPGHESCGAPFTNAPQFHLMDQRGCGENDPNGPVFDPVHGVIHHFYQDHLAAQPGSGPPPGGPIYGHFVSKDFVHWAQMPVAIWNGLDTSTWPPRKTPYDEQAIFTGSAVTVEGAGPGGKGPGIVQIYPGLCNKDWPECKTGTLLAQAVPADYAGDELLTNWSKPSYNPVVNNTQRDPTTPWKTASGEWRMRTYDSKVYGSASDADLLAGKWYDLGANSDFHVCECPSFYPLPASTPGTEHDYAAALKRGKLPTHVHKWSCNGDWWQLGTYTEPQPKGRDSFKATPGWEDLFAEKRMDAGNFYASKDNTYPSANYSNRRINWGWAQVPPQSTQTLPRVITFNAAARTLEQAPIDELRQLRSDASMIVHAMAVQPGHPITADKKGVVKQSEVNVSFVLPKQAATFGVQFVTGQKNTSCMIEYTPPQSDKDAFYEVPVFCDGVKDTLRLLSPQREPFVELRIFADHTFVEAYFQKGRVAITHATATPLVDDTTMRIVSSAKVLVQAGNLYAMKSIWVTPEEVRKAPRVFPSGPPAQMPDVVFA